ncbi:MAG TPA: class I SAM-dependent methyltransferase [Candidatus Limnocylindrales bacterium]
MTGRVPRDPATAEALARLYDLDVAEDPGDLDLYLALAARTGGPILELAVGSGRLAVPLAAAGWDVTGVDIDSAMLARARTAAAAARSAGGRPASEVGTRLHLVEADLVDLRLESAGTFRLAFIALNSLLVLGTRAAQRAAVGTLAAHLAPGGIAAIDIWQPDAEDLARFDGRLVLEYPRTEPETGRIVTKISSATHDAATQRVELISIYEEALQGQPAVRWVRQDTLRLVSADELVGYAEDAGLEIEQLAGGYDLDPIAPASDRAILVAVRR